MKDLEGIKQDIKDYKISLLAISELSHCEGCKDKKDLTPHTHPDVHFDQPDDAFIYTIGHRESNRPDMLFFIGPQIGGPLFNPEQLREQIRAGASLINYLVGDWDNNPVLLGHNCQDRNGRVYQVVEHIENGPHEFKDEYTTKTSKYYGSDDYELLVVAAVTWNKVRSH